MSTLNTCQTCPSFLTSDRVPSKFRKGIGAPMCGRFGHVLGRPGGDPKSVDKLSAHHGSKCPSYGEPLPGQPLQKLMLVALPDPDVMQPAEDPQKRDLCKTCTSCTKYVPDEQVLEEFGWTAGLCSAKGKIVLPTETFREAKGCEYREWGTTRKTTLGLHLLPEYEDAFNLSVDPVRSYFKNKGEVIEPHEYESDKEVSDEEVASGIRAWRKVKDPDGSGNETYLPVYRSDYFSDDEQAKIPRTGDDEHPELYVDHFGGVYLAAVAWTELDETPAAWGEAGVGKTELARHLAWLMCLPFERISITGQTELDDLAGKMRFTQDRGTYFQYGRLPLAWAKPCVLVIDEPNVGPADVWQFLRPLTDNSKQMVLDVNEGERIKRHEDCYMMMAMNPAWDVKNVGALPIGDADANRLFHVFIPLPPDSLEREIIANRVKLDGWEIDMDRLNMLLGIAKELRALAEQGTLPISWGIRPQIKVARALRWFSPEVAYKRAVGDYLEPDAQQVLADVIQAHVAK
jgi:MoxR-like ATPase